MRTQIVHVDRGSLAHHSQVRRIAVDKRDLAYRLMVCVERKQRRAVARTQDNHLTRAAGVDAVPEGVAYCYSVNKIRGDHIPDARPRIRVVVVQHNLLVTSDDQLVPKVIQGDTHKAWRRDLTLHSQRDVGAMQQRRGGFCRSVTMVVTGA
eukprot:4742324-Prymnesium_polylepis.1